MASFLYLTNPAKLRNFLQAIQKGGTPKKLTLQKLAGMGFKGSNDRSIIPALKYLRFLDSSGVPTDRWKLYRDKNKAPAVLAESIKEHYAELYDTYPDAHTKDNEALRNFFGAHTDVSANTQLFIVNSFKTLVTLADFEAVAPKPSLPATKVPPKEKPPVTPSIRSKDSGCVVNVNIQLTLPEGATFETFEAFFKAMRKHLID